ncbi:BQ2448_4551 [Microbotryum intermedium]|uniref:BQ2448_4551 protein n=1 Tax=Microbotryum intermedium TaxID=269621 RepID=A0A238FF54_9BASI|nr:BQ2448_4551 [Microbotryum intermedium]
MVSQTKHESERANRTSNQHAPKEGSSTNNATATTSGSGEAAESDKTKGKKRAGTLDSTLSVKAKTTEFDGANDLIGYFATKSRSNPLWRQGLQDESSGSIEGVPLVSRNGQRLTTRQIVREQQLQAAYPPAASTTTTAPMAFSSAGISNNSTGLYASVAEASSIASDPPYHPNTHDSTATLDNMRSEVRQQHEKANAIIRDLMMPLNSSSEFWTSTDEDGARMLGKFTTSLLSHPADNSKLQAIQLIACKSSPRPCIPKDHTDSNTPRPSDHVRNKHQNSSYHLPPALRATDIQQSISHPAWVDAIIFPSLRDRVILLPKDRCDLRTLWSDLMDHVDLSIANWEISEDFMKKYSYLIDENILAISNRWRVERRERMLEMKDILPHQ